MQFQKSRRRHRWNLHTARRQYTRPHRLYPLATNHFLLAYPYSQTKYKLFRQQASGLRGLAPKLRHRSSDAC